MGGNAPSEPAIPEQTFLAERLWPGVTQEAATAEVERLALATNELRCTGRPVRHIRSNLIPKDETVFNWFCAQCPGDVAAVGGIAGVEFDRIVLVVPLASTAA